MTDKKAQKLIKKIIDDLDQNGIITNTIVEDLKELRPYAVQEKRPVVAKAIRLTYEHIEEFETFAIDIPEDEAIVDDESGEVLSTSNDSESGPTESLIYLIALIQKEELRRNKQEIRVFNDKLKAYAEEYGEY